MGITSIVDDDVVLIRVLRPEVVRPGNLLLRRGIVDLFAKVPVERQVMAESSDQLAVLKLALRAQVALVQQ